jgi:hypothetical protein
MGYGESAFHGGMRHAFAVLEQSLSLDFAGDKCA